MCKKFDACLSACLLSEITFHLHTEPQLNFVQQELHGLVKAKSHERLVEKIFPPKLSENSPTLILPIHSRAKLKSHGQWWKDFSSHCYGRVDVVTLKFMKYGRHGRDALMERLDGMADPGEGHCASSESSKRPVISARPGRPEVVNDRSHVTDCCVAAGARCPAWLGMVGHRGPPVRCDKCPVGRRFHHGSDGRRKTWCRWRN